MTASPGRKREGDVPAPRPTVTARSSPTVSYGATVDLTIQAATPKHNITRATLLRLGSVTHWVDTDQRFVELETPTEISSNVWRVTARANAMDAPPGYYVLFLLNDLGVPSVAVSTSPALAILKLQS